jgi:hypothetical protein
VLFETVSLSVTNLDEHLAACKELGKTARCCMTDVCGISLLPSLQHLLCCYALGLVCVELLANVDTVARNVGGTTM